MIDEFRAPAQAASRRAASGSAQAPAQAASRRAASGSAKNNAGFTLIEMLVALAVFALAAMALLNLAGESTRSAVRVEARTLGGVVAENIAAEAMIAPSLPVGETAGEVQMAGRVWRWRRIVTGTEVPGMGRIDVRVSTDEGQVADRVLFRAAGA